MSKRVWELSGGGILAAVRVGDSDSKGDTSAYGGKSNTTRRASMLPE